MQSFNQIDYYDTMHTVRRLRHIKYEYIIMCRLTRVYIPQNLERMHQVFEVCPAPPPNFNGR